VALTLVFVDLQDRLTHLGADLTLGNTRHKEHIPVVVQEQAQHTAVNFGWVVQ